MELLTELGLGTGFPIDSLYDKRRNRSRAGIDIDIRKENTPYIIKSPWFCDHVDEATNKLGISIEHVFVPMRDIKAAADSRRLVQSEALAELPQLKRVKAQLSGRIFDGALFILIHYKKETGRSPPQPALFTHAQSFKNQHACHLVELSKIDH
jgi:hypothetical protein